MTKREELRFKTAHEEYGYSKLSSEHLAFEKGAEWADNNIDENSILKWLRNQTGCGLMDGKDAINKLIFALRHHPSVVMDNPLKMEIVWKYKNED